RRRVLTQPHAAVGTWARTPPLTIAPVDEVVFALPARLSPVGDLIPLETCLDETLVNHAVAVGVDVLIGCRQLPAPDLTGHRGAVLDDEGISGDVVHVCLDDSSQAAGQLLGRLGR